MDLSIAAVEQRVQEATVWLSRQDNEHSRELLDYIESLEDALHEEGIGSRHVVDRFYVCCPRIVGTGHKFGCSSREREVYSARLNTDGSYTLGERR